MVTKEQTRQLVIKPEFLQNISHLPGKEVHQIMEKITLLTINPLPDGKLKKQLKYHPGRPYRLRAGVYRIFYTFNQQCVSIFQLDRRSDDTYQGEIVPGDLPSADVLNDLDIDMGDVITVPPYQDNATYTNSNHQPDHQQWEQAYTTLSQKPARPLPEPFTSEILKTLQIPASYHQRILTITDEDGIYNCPGLDETTCITLHDYMFTRPLLEVMQQKNLLVNDPQDIVRYHEGELLSFLLQLSPEQEKYASWSLTTNGPTLVKGGPGTGKSTVALYRLRSLLQQLRQQSDQPPHFLFTTYTNALIRSSKQQLEQLLGEDAQYVRVATADSIGAYILKHSGQLDDYHLATSKELAQITQQAIANTTFSGNLIQQKAQRLTIERLGNEYLRQEFDSIIIARQLVTLPEYQRTPRTGRQVPFNATQRQAVWTVYENWCQLLQARHLETWNQRRVRALTLTPQSGHYQHYDAVIIDEAQDLDPASLRMLIQLSKAPNRIFVTADANQSIYGSSFSWSEVHSSLKFQGRTSILRTNYRSTAQIGEAARSYLAHDTLEPEPLTPLYANTGPRPDIYFAHDINQEVQLLAINLKNAVRFLHLTTSSCAILCPSEHAGMTLASKLREHGLEATYMMGKELNLNSPGIKILNLKSSKGLEFPVVALAGFTLSPDYPPLPSDITDDERPELLARERRTLFVGMTRAMRLLFLIIPDPTTSPLLQHFNEQYWNIKRQETV